MQLSNCSLPVRLPRGTVSGGPVPRFDEKSFVWNSVSWKRQGRTYTSRVAATEADALTGDCGQVAKALDPESIGHDGPSERTLLQTRLGQRLSRLRVHNGH